MEDRIRYRLEKAVTDSVFPGGVVGVVDTFGNQSIIPGGRFTYEKSAPIVKRDSIYDVASITKSIPVASLALYLIDRRMLTLDQKIAETLPALRTNFRDEITARHLLSQSLSFTEPLSSYKDLGADEIIEKILTTQFSEPPGEHMSYSNATSILLGLLIEELSGKSLPELAQEIFFNPLRMQDTSFYPEDLPGDRIVPTEHDRWRGRVIRGEVHDESAFILREKIVPGSAGLFSTAPDLLKFLRMLLNRGKIQGRQFFSEAMISAMATNQLQSGHGVVGLGWELDQPRYMGKNRTAHTIGKTGFTGCVVLCDIGLGKAFVILSNYHFPNRKQSVAALDALRRDIADIVFS